MVYMDEWEYNLYMDLQLGKLIKLCEYETVCGEVVF